MRHVFLLLLLTSLGLWGCGKKSAPATQDAAAEAAPVAAAGDATSASEPPVPAAPPAVAIDEHMPPIDESKGAPQLMLTGQLLPLNPEQDVSGNVMLYKMPDQSHLLRIENLHFINAAPDLDLALARIASPHSPEDLQNLLALGALKGPSGNMNYLIPKEQDVSEMHSLVLLLRGDNQLFASASLSR